MHWATPLIGKKWVLGGRGPDVFDCWGLVHWAYMARFGVSLPLYPKLDVLVVGTVSKLLQDGAKSKLWERVNEPFDGCVTGLSQNKLFHHVGIFTEANGGVIVHADLGGVVAQSPAQMRARGWGRIEYYKYCG